MELKEHIKWMMIVQMDKMSAPPSRERAQRLYEKVSTFPVVLGLDLLKILIEFSLPGLCVCACVIYVFFKITLVLYTEY